MLLTIRAIVTDLQEERALVAPHIVEHIADKVTRNGDQGDEVAFARWFARLDALIHSLVAGHTMAEMLSDVDGGIAAIR